MLVNVNSLYELTGIDRRTIKKRLGDLPFTVNGRANEYNSAKALEAIYCATQEGEPGELELTAERARLAHHQANKTELEEKALRGELLRYDEVAEAWGRVAAMMRAKFLALPTKAAAAMTGAETVSERRDIIKTHVCEILSELSDDEPSAADRSANQGDVKTTNAAA